MFKLKVLKPVIVENRMYVVGDYLKGNKRVRVFKRLENARNYAYELFGVWYPEYLEII